MNPWLLPFKGFYLFVIIVYLCKAFLVQSNPIIRKIGLDYFARALQSWGMEWMDCQIMNPHLKSLGAVEIPRREFLNNLEAALKLKTKKGSWTTILPINSEP